MCISDEAASAIARAARTMVRRKVSDRSLAQAVLDALAEAASLKDWDVIDELKP